MRIVTYTRKPFFGKTAFQTPTPNNKENMQTFRIAQGDKR